MRHRETMNGRTILTMVEQPFLPDHEVTVRWKARRSPSVRWSVGQGDRQHRQHYRQREAEARCVHGRQALAAIATARGGPRVYEKHDPFAQAKAIWERLSSLDYDEIKTDLLEREEAIRSRTPAGVRQELWAIALGYNLVRVEMARVADEAGVPPFLFFRIGPPRE